jgi:hypothetical protein
MILGDGPQFSIGLAAGCLIWIPVVIGIVSLIGWMIQGEIDTVFGLVCVLALLTMGGLALVSKNQDVAPYLMGGAFSAVLLFPIARSQKNSRDLAKLDLEKLEKAYEELKSNPRNLGARFQVAKILHSRGLADQAIVLAEEALKGAPRGVFEEELQTLKKWKRQPIAQPVPGITCLSCGQKNKAGSPFCKACGGPILLYYAKGQWINPYSLRKVMLIWLAILVPLVGVPLAKETLSANEVILAAVALLTISAILLFLALKVIKDVDA